MIPLARGRRLLVLVIVLAGWVARSPAAVETVPPVMILVSPGPTVYRDAAQSIRESLGRSMPQARIETVLLVGGQDEPSARRALTGSRAVVVAVGSRAARLARESGQSSPLVYALVLDPAAIGLPVPGETSASQVTGVAMDVTPAQQFAALREVAPGVLVIGVLYDPAVSGAEVRRAEVAARASGLRLVAQPVRDEGEVLAAARLLAPDVDALWAVADPTVLTAANARALILLSLRARKPLFAMSESYVRSGALAALAADPKEVGRRAGELAGLVLSGKPAAELRPEAPPRVSLFINRASAGHLGIVLPDALLLRAKKVYPEP